MAKAEGVYKLERDTKRYHRFDIKLDNGGVGTLYLPKDVRPLPKEIVLRYEE
ncbi:MAG: hypothetical protein JRI51_05600 [Deltaproteobacteria bacterium]|nr:hypothetical protein [Deltaproteobacteria bacterium]